MFREALPAWHRPLLDFILRYGVRLNEAFFPPEAFDAPTEEAAVRKRKNGLPHIVTLLPEDAELMAERVRLARAGGFRTVWLRPNGKGLRAITPRAFQSACQAALRKTGIADARPVHDWRHHAGTTLLRRTNNLKLVQELLGHENIASTVRYAHAGRAALREGLRHAYGTKAEETSATPSPLKARTGT
jgi:integrase